MVASEGVDLEWAIAEKIQIKNNKIKKFSRPLSAKILDQADKCVKNKVKFDVRGKSRSGITGLAFRIDLRP